MIILSKVVLSIFAISSVATTISAQGDGDDFYYRNRSPSDQPSKLESEQPSKLPSDQASKMPSDLPSKMPSKVISDQPSKLPSNQPSVMPSDQSSKMPSAQLSAMPSDQPSKLESEHPSKLPSDQASKMPSDLPSKMPSKVILDQLSKLPSNQPSVMPSDQSSKMPSAKLSEMPTSKMSSTSGPITSAPTTSVPTTTLHTTSSPTTSVPVTSSPTTSAPITSGPVTSAPTTSVPSTTMRMTSSPTTSVPVTSAPTTSAPITSGPITSAPTTSVPSTTLRMTSSPTTSSPTFTSSPSLITFTPTTSAPMTFSPITFNKTVELLNDSTVIVEETKAKINESCPLMPKYVSECDEMRSTFTGLGQSIVAFNTTSNTTMSRRLEDIDDSTQDALMIELLGVVGTAMNDLETTLESVDTDSLNLNFDNFLDEIVTLIQDVTEKNPELVTPVPSSAPTITSAPTHTSNQPSIMLSDQPSTSNQPSIMLSDQLSKMPSAQLSEIPTSKMASTSVPTTSAPTTSVPTTTKTSSPTTPAPMTSVPTTSVPTTSTPTVTSSIRSPHPTYDYSADCEDASVCDYISQMSTAKERKKACGELKWREAEPMAEETCPIACGNLKCYKFTQACKDFETGQFVVLNQTQQCSWIKWMRVSEENPIVPWICLSAAVPMNSSNVALDYSYLAQDRCQESCQNPACTCGDRTFPFWTDGYDNTSDTMSMVDDNTKSDAGRERNCKDLYNMTTSERDTVCELDIRGVTSHLSKPTNDIPAIIKVNYMCPKACGNRTECFCTDSTDMVPTPNRANVERQCHWARGWSADKLAGFCDESIEPYFARACAITCKNPRCDEHDSTYSLELFGNVVSTTCRQIYEYSKSGLLGKGEEYVRLMCGAKDYGKMLFTHELCPMACKDVDLLP